MPYVISQFYFFIEFYKTNAQFIADFNSPFLIDKVFYNNKGKNNHILFYFTFLININVT